MHALQFTATGDLRHLALVDLPRPVPAAGDVLIRVDAAGLNPSDVKNVLGRFPYTTLPRVPGRDVAGTVEAGPAELIGRAVWATGREPGFTRDGSHAEWLCLPAGGVALKPASLSFAQAAACGVPYTTAWDGLRRAGLDGNQRVLVIGANGAVGSAAIGLARAAGAAVLAAVRDKGKQRQLEAEGYSCLMLDNPDTLAEQVAQHFPEGADIIFDTTGFWLAPAVAALNRFGHLVVIAAPANGMAELPLLALYRKGASIVGANSLLYGCEDCAEMLREIGALFDSHALPLPTPPTEVALDEGLASYARINAGSSEKVVLRPAR
ncbi:dehydrogenase [Isoalcanivorax pacificus W11-5]|uniref:Dehydrogenase n=1 Tax=Isoalcanivorax pacificus W11-5 TaxID=391936 RepID=A0A0B4XRB8_9GAMM|nr:zinc-binding alcohol dehydrogenase family protein [Isoalcanivorax pacificus]AJD48948.1 dehydrogenase [Isoalcanivorax pacificus W11-5]